MTPPAAVEAEPFGETPDGRAVERFTIRDGAGLRVQAITYGAIITAIVAPDRHGTAADVALGFDDLAGYLPRHPYFGALVGRCANRIAGARFTLGGRVYPLAANNGRNHLHGGARGFDRHVWDAEALEDGVVFTRRSPDGEEGYPGNLDVRVAYRLAGRGELSVEYRAVTDAPTPVNLTQHSYFNLAGHDAGTVLDHELVLRADGFVPIDATLIPSGPPVPVDGTPLDFRTPRRIGDRIDDPFPQLRHAGGYDHTFVLARGAGERPAARLVDPSSGRSLDIATTEPGVQFYSGNLLDGSFSGKGGVVYGRRAGLCLETQHYPDSPNRPEFPTTILQPGAVYESRTVYRFGVAG